MRANDVRAIGFKYLIMLIRFMLGVIFFHVHALDLPLVLLLLVLFVFSAFLGDSENTRDGELSKIANYHSLPRSLLLFYI
jgi:hypothetical protein